MYGTLLGIPKLSDLEDYMMVGRGGMHNDRNRDREGRPRRRLEVNLELELLGLFPSVVGVTKVTV